MFATLNQRLLRRSVRQLADGAPRNDKKQNGFTILETIIAFFIITIGMVGVLTLVVQNVQVQYINKNVLIASHLAQEGLELVRNVRDNNWLTPGHGWTQDIVGDGTYTIDYRGRMNINNTANDINDAGAKLYIDSNGFYSHEATAEATNFYRLITVVDNSGNGYLDVECKIRWLEKAQNYDYTAKTLLYDWR